MPNMKEPMTEENKRRAEVEEHWDYPIRIDVDYILGRFETNHNKLEYFENDDTEYWELIKKAIVINCRMAEYYREKSLWLSRYKFDDIRITGGGGYNDIGRVGVSRNVAFWNPSIGEVEINFKEKTINVWMNEWEDKEKNINSFNGRKLYIKEIENLDEELEMYKKKYYYKERNF